VAHPEHPAMPHAEDDDAASAVDEASAQAAAAIDATDPGTVIAPSETSVETFAPLDALTEPAPESAATEA
jgi:hypothetical protein